MKIYEIATGYTSIPATISAATEIVIEQLTTAMISNGKDVEIIDIRDKNRKDTNLKIDEVAVPSFLTSTDTSLGIIHKLKRVIYSISLAGKLKKILKKTNDKVVFHFHNQYNMFFFLKLTGKKEREKCIMAYTNHSGIWSLEWEEVEPTLKKRYFQEWECQQNADILYILNDDTKANVINHLGVDENKIVRINNGVNTDVYRPLSLQEKEAIKADYGVTGKKIILQVGSVYDNKGQDRAIKYLTQLMKEDPDLMYLYAGGIVDEEYHNRIKKYVADNGLDAQVKYLGMLSPGEELNRVYNMADATISLSKYEAFSLVVVESYSAGVPMLIDESNKSVFSIGAVLYNKDNFESKVKDIIFGDKENYQQLSDSVRSIATNNYSWAAIAKNYTDSWEK
ncbi:MAG: glycosyltransferase family 4 protein [Eubacteriales bacterium]|nr:glycosyltransferase family 4 protein [Eubacteriales bacterium]